MSTCIEVEDVNAPMQSRHLVNELLDRIIRGLIQLQELPVGWLQCTPNSTLDEARIMTIATYLGKEIASCGIIVRLQIS